MDFPVISLCQFQSTQAPVQFYFAHKLNSWKLWEKTSSVQIGATKTLQCPRRDGPKDVKQMTWG